MNLPIGSVRETVRTVGSHSELYPKRLWWRSLVGRRDRDAPRGLGGGHGDPHVHLYPPTQLQHYHRHHGQLYCHSAHQPQPVRRRVPRRRPHPTGHQLGGETIRFFFTENSWKRGIFPFFIGVSIIHYIQFFLIFYKLTLLIWANFMKWLIRIVTSRRNYQLLLNKSESLFTWFIFLSGHWESIYLAEHL